MGCGGSKESPSQNPAISQTSPIQIKTDAAKAAADVMSATQVSASFKQPVDPSSTVGLNEGGGYRIAPGVISDFIGFYDISLMDDNGRSQLCLNSITWQWRYQILIGFAQGVYFGTSPIHMNGNSLVFEFDASSPLRMYGWNDLQAHRASFTLSGISGGFVFSTMFDMNTLDSPRVCYGEDTVAGPKNDVGAAVAPNASLSYRGYYDMSLVDDNGRSQLCLNSETGAWRYEILIGFGSGVYFGTSPIHITGTSLVFAFDPSSPLRMYGWNDLQAHRASFTLNGISGGQFVFSTMFDMNTTNDPQNCGLPD